MARADAGLIFDLSLQQRTGFRMRARGAIRPGPVTGLFGESGSGKTTLLRCLAGFEPQCHGSIIFNGQTLQDDRQRVSWPGWRRPIGMVFAEPRLFPHLDVRGNLGFAMRRSGQPQARCTELAARLGVTPLMSRPIDQLSLGESRRVALLRVLLKGAPLLLLDEAFAGLDRDTHNTVMRVILEEARGTGTQLVQVSHDLDTLTRSCDHLLVMREGVLSDAGDVGAALGNPDIFDRDQLGVVLVATQVRYDPRSGLSRVNLADGPGQLLLPGPAPDCRGSIRILARDVSIAVEDLPGSSILNRIPAVVADVRMLGDHALVGMDCHGQRILACISRHSLQALGIGPGAAVYAQIKAAALRW